MKRVRECCGEEFTDSMVYAQHRYKHHRVVRHLTCDVCGAVIRGRGAFDRHRQEHDPERQRARFFAKVDQDGPVPEYAPHLGPCWIWQACTDSKGYGRFRAVNVH